MFTAASSAGAAPRRIAVLGGGAAALTAAFELTATPELRRRNDVTVFQTGWRLGGKGASGRNRERGQRIEEHGLHVWFGFYDNAFDLMRRTYAEAGRTSAKPLSGWREAFEPVDDVVLLERHDERWRPRPWHFPPNDLPVGEPIDYSYRGLLVRALLLLRDRLQGLDDDLRRECEPWVRRLLGVVALQRQRRARVPVPVPSGQSLLDAALLTHRPLPRPVERAGQRPLAHGLRALRAVAWRTGERNEALVEHAMAFDLFATIFLGILEDDLLVRGLGAINDEELTAWLRRHGLRERTAETSPMLRSFYQLCFAYEDGDRARPNLAAGKAVQVILRMALTYKGSVMWKMQAGMGDAVFAPLYEVLRRRGVRFEFFHHVGRLGLAPDGRDVATIAVVRQATPRGGEYEPLVDVRGVPSWPSEPLWDQLVEGDELRGGVDLEEDPNPLGRAPRILRRGVDFDDVVLGIPPAALRPMCADLEAANPRFAAMVENSRSIGTQAFQAWLRRPGSELGWPFHGRRTVAGAHEAPLDTYCDMTHLLPREDWPEDVAHCAYFCGAMREVPGETHEEALERSRADAAGHLRRHGADLWPAARTSTGDFDWSALHDPEDREGEARLDAQYWRANVAGSERYVQTPAGSLRWRLRPGDSGFGNLVLAGDWTRNGISGGSVEAAVTSGRLAAQALCGAPADVPGVDGWLEED